jgi:hypothetical protein
MNVVDIRGCHDRAGVRRMEPDDGQGEAGASTTRVVEVGESGRKPPRRMVAEDLMSYRQYVINQALQMTYAAAEAVKKGDEELAVEYRRAEKILLHAVDGEGMFAPLYRLGLFMHGENIFLNHTIFFLKEGFWTTGTKYIKGKLKGELIVKLSHEKFLKFLTENDYVPSITE